MEQRQQVEQHGDAPTGPQKPAAKRKKRPVISASTATFIELQKILQEMRPYTLQVLRTPYYRNCKAARNMRRGMRQIRELCKQVRIETVSLGKRTKMEGIRRRWKPTKQASLECVSAPGTEEGTGLDVIAEELLDGRNEKNAPSEHLGLESVPIEVPAPSK